MAVTPRGGQQFATLLDTRNLDRVVVFDRDRGLIEVEAGIQWPALIDFLVQAQAGTATTWGIAIALRGSYYLTYHRWATRPQVEACYPRFPAFLSEKRQHDPHGLFQSDWYRYHCRIFDR